MIDVQDEPDWVPSRVNMSIVTLTKHSLSEELIEVVLTVHVLRKVHVELGFLSVFHGKYSIKVEK